MSDSITEITSEGWFSRIGGAIKGVLFGAALTLLSCAVLFWNEGRAVKTARALEEGRGIAVAVGSDAVNAANEGKLIVASGEAMGMSGLLDPEFGIAADGIALHRKVSYYQWVEDKQSSTEKKLGGGTETVTRYKYSMKWVDSPVDSSRFKDTATHQNPGVTHYKNERFRAKEVKLGAFTLSDKLASGITKSESLTVTEANYQALPDTLKAQVKWSSGTFYLGLNPASPMVGDEKIEFGVVKPQNVTVLGRQAGNGVAGYGTAGGRTLESIRAGILSKEEFFAAEKSDTVMMTWIIRLVGFVVCFIGLLSILRPLSVLADVVPFIGGLVGMGTGLISFLVALMLTAISVALGWFAYRPLLSVALLATGAGIAYYLLQRRGKFAAEKRAMAPAGARA
jgi:Transmembrane protein 43